MATEITRYVIPKRLALVGHGSTGKDTIGRLLGKRWGYARVAMGDQIKCRLRNMRLQEADRFLNWLHCDERLQDCRPGYIASAESAFRLVIDGGIHPDTEDQEEKAKLRALFETFGLFIYADLYRELNRHLVNARRDGGNRCNTRLFLLEEAHLWKAHGGSIWRLEREWAQGHPAVPHMEKLATLELDTDGDMFDLRIKTVEGDIEEQFLAALRNNQQHIQSVVPINDCHIIDEAITVAGF